MKILCWLETLWNEIRYMPPATISGHIYDTKNSEVFLDHVVIVDYCSRCGEASISHCSRAMYEQMKAEGKV